MPAFKICQPEDRVAASFPRAEGMQASGSIASQTFFAMPGRPLLAWLHDMSAGAEIKWDKPPVGHCLFVLQGEIDANGKRIGKFGTAMVEHGAAMRVKSLRDNTRVLHFYKEASVAGPTLRPGGGLHINDDKGIYQFHVPGAKRHGTLHAESECPTCELWLHTSMQWPSGASTEPHYHIADEIIYVIDGSMLFGRNELRTGGAIAIDGKTSYSFKAGSNGLSFVNFRSDMPGYVAMKRDGKPLEVQNESDKVRKRERYVPAAT